MTFLKTNNSIFAPREKPSQKPRTKRLKIDLFTNAPDARAKVSPQQRVLEDRRAQGGERGWADRV